MLGVRAGLMDGRHEILVLPLRDPIVASGRHNILPDEVCGGLNP